MRILIHAGLHKSGTTSVQACWARGFEQPGDAWYPAPEAGGPGHAVAAFAFRNDPYSRHLAATLDPEGASTLDRYVERARALGVRRLVLSSEEFDHFDPDDWERLRRLADPDRIEALITVTRPAHRWYSMWQELVKHGLPARPADAARLLASSTLLDADRLDRLVRSIGAERTIVRIVRTDPPEDDLADALGAMVGLPSVPPDARGTAPANVSIGHAADLLRALNATDETIGLLTAESRERFAAALESTSVTPEFASPPEDFDAPGWARDAALRERQALEALAAAGIAEVADPHDLAGTWGDWTPPQWVRSLQQAGWEIPGASDVEAWRAVLTLSRRLVDARGQRDHALADGHQALLQRDAALAEFQRVRQDAEWLGATLEDAQARIRSLEASVDQLARALDSITESRSWRLTSPLRAFTAAGRGALGGRRADDA